MKGGGCVLVDVGFESYINSDRIVAIIDPSTEPIRQAIKAAKAEDMFINLSRGQAARSMIITDVGHIYASHISPTALLARLNCYSV